MVNHLEFILFYWTWGRAYMIFCRYICLSRSVKCKRRGKENGSFEFWLNIVVNLDGEYVVAHF